VTAPSVVALRKRTAVFVSPVSRPGCDRRYVPLSVPLRAFPDASPAVVPEVSPRRQYALGVSLSTVCW